MATIARVIGPNASEFGKVFFDEDWGGYGWEIDDDFVNGPFETAEEAADALVEELSSRTDYLRRIDLTGAIDRMVRECRRHDEED